MKYFSLKIWSVSSLFLAVGVTSLWFAARLLGLLLNSSNEVFVWLLSNSGHFKRAFLSLCCVVAAFYTVRAIRAGTLWLESKSRKERGL